jgi:16S rRNA (adenine1518-N6/adenine1519-N6)-dimethyltransferase
MPVKPKLGQNFLDDAEAVEGIVAALGNLTGQTVVEIGPGGGAITAALASRAGRVIAVEFDRELAIQLRARLSPDIVSVIEADALRFDFAAASATAGDRLPVAGNLPYGITSQILLKLAASHAALDRAVLMVQREVADRIVAAPGSRDYGLLSVTVQMYGPVERLFTLPPSSFIPPPDVHSTVFRCDLPNWVLPRPAFSASCARPSRKSARRWPTIFAPRPFRRRSSQACCMR